MLSTLTKQKVARLAAIGTTVALTIAAGASVNADPKQYEAIVGTGSDTTQDVMNALAGHTNGFNFLPAQSSAATGQRQLISFDAIELGATAQCITPKIGAPTFDRPNGSSNGRRSLSRAIDGTGWGKSGACGPIANVSGQIDFARSSSGPASGDTGTALTYVPLARDALSFAYYKASGGTVVGTLTRAQITSLFTTGAQTINGVNVVPCGIQTGSGTYEFWNKVTTATVAQEDAATATCNAYGGLGRAQENDGVALKARGDAAPADTQVVIGFSAGAYVAKTNGVALPTPPAGVQIGMISNDGAGNNLGSPVQPGPTAGTLAPVAGFYNNATFGRTVYNVFDSNKIGGSAFANQDLKTIFLAGTNPNRICNKTSVIETLGFLVAPDCGSTTLKGSLLVGQ